jgi:hypothetical protein
LEKEKGKSEKDTQAEDGKFTKKNGKKQNSAVAEIFGVGGGIAEIVVDENGGLAGKLEAFAAFEAGHEVIKPHHERSSFGELAAVFFAGAARQFPFLARDFPADGKFEFAAATRANELDLPGFFLFRVKRALIHD